MGEGQQELFAVAEEPAEMWFSQLEWLFQQVYFCNTLFYFNTVELN